MTEVWTTKRYWDERYRRGGNSGAGSAGHLGAFKTRFLNSFIARHGITSITDLGCGDGQQIANLRVARYTGYDASFEAIKLCRARITDQSYSFHVLESDTIIEPSELCISLDTIYCLVEDDVYIDHVHRLFNAAERFVVIYGNQSTQRQPSVRHLRFRDFSTHIERLAPDWTLVDVVQNPFYSEDGNDPNRSWSSFFIYASAAEPNRLNGRYFHPLAVELNRARYKHVLSDGAGPACDADNLAHVAWAADAALIIEPVRDDILQTVVAGNPNLPVTLVTPGGDPKASERLSQLVERFGPRIGLADGVSIGDALARHGARHPSCQTLLYLPATALALLTVDRMRAIRDRARNPTVIIAEIGSSPHQREQLEILASDGFLRRAIAPLAGLRHVKESGQWIGSLQHEPFVVVSLTTIRARIASVVRVIDSILSQSLQAAYVVLNISAEPYLRDQGIPESEVPVELRQLERQGLLQICYVTNTGPHRKLLPTLQRFRNANCVIVTADDDTLYPRDWLRRLFETYLAEQSIVAYRCHRLLIRNGRPTSYMDSMGVGDNPEVRPEYRSLFLLPTGKDGVLYAPEFFPLASFDPAVVGLAPTADDLLFKFLTMSMRTPVTRISHRSAGGADINDFAAVPDGSPESLWAINQRRNDETVARLLAEFESRGWLKLREFLRAESS